MKITYTKAMIDLIYEIRRRVPSDLKPSIKLANPDILKELLNFFNATNDAVLKALIKELMSLAGEPWESSLTTSDAPEENMITKIYRGQTILTKRPTKKTKENAPKRIYRGQVIE